MDKKMLMEQIRKNVGICKKCRLFEKAKNSVPGEGSVDAELIFIGEAPGAVEDATGRPFVGRAGMLLERLLKDIGLKRSDVWIGNIMKHRPPENRDPLPDEIAACTPYLKMQLEALKPKIIVTLGRFAMNYFYKGGKISRDHGAAKKVGSMIIFPVYHPAAALRNGSMMGALEEDFKKIPELLEFIRRGEDPPMLKEEESNDGQIGLGL